MKKDFSEITYLHKHRWISFWYQIQEVAMLEDAEKILEIGVGSHVVADVLSRMDYAVEVLDVDEELKPDIVADIRTLDNNILKNKYDAVLCFQVLEHIPYSDFLKALENIRELSNNYVLISLPYSYSGNIKLRAKIKFTPKMKAINFIKIFDFFPKKHIYDGKHYWELGKKGYTLRKVLKDIQSKGLMIKKNYPIFENPYHYIIVCEKMDKL